MPREILDIVPPDRPEETPLPRIVAAPPEEDDGAYKAKKEEKATITRQIHHQSVYQDAPEYIDEPPPYVSRIPSREEHQGNQFFEKKKERTPFSAPTGMSPDARLSAKHFATITVLVLLVIGYIGLSIFFRNATITVTPKTEKVVLNTHLTAAAEDSKGLDFTVITLTATETKDVLASGTKTVSTKASGKIIVYNEYSAKSQRLIKNTRFQTPEGKIYRIAESITVPGVTTLSGKTIPGKSEVTVYADEAGADFNIPVTDFTIPGLKGDPRFQKMYARSKTPMTGGFTGAMRIVSDEDMEGARTEIEAKLKDRLHAQTRKDQPKEYVMYDEGMYVITKPIERDDAASPDESHVRVTGEATMYALMFSRAKLAQAVAKEVVPNYDGSPITIPDIELLRAQIIEKDQGDVWNQKQVMLNLTGDARLIWVVDTEMLNSALLGKDRKAFSGVLATFPTINEAKASFRPFWFAKSFPSDPKRIDVEVINP